MKRSDRFHILFSADERKMLDAMAERDGVTSAAKVRAMVLKEYRASGLTSVKSPKRSRA